jgi:hypothetical protein
MNSSSCCGHPEHLFLIGIVLHLNRVWFGSMVFMMQWGNAEEMILQRIKDSNVAVLNFSAWNKQMSVTALSDWGGASNAIRRQLNKKCKEPRMLHFQQNALYEMTYND